MRQIRANFSVTSADFLYMAHSSALFIGTVSPRRRASSREYKGIWLQTVSKPNLKKMILIPRAVIKERCLYLSRIY